MSPTLNLRRFVVYALICSLSVSGLLTSATRQSLASNNSLTRSPAPTVNKSVEKAAPNAKTVDKATRSRVHEALGKLPLSFEENRGQVDKEVRYVSRGRGYTLFLTSSEAVLALPKTDKPGRSERQARDLSNPQSTRIERQPARPQSAALRMKLSGANLAPTVSGESEMGVKTNYFTGSDPRTWHTDISRYRRVRYAQVYPGVDMIYSGRQSQLEYRLEVAPGADARQIALEFEGVEQVKISSKTGELILATAGGVVRQRKPSVFQEVGGRRKGIKSWYVLEGTNKVRIEVEEYDRTQRLMIAPALIFSTHLKEGQDYGYGIAIDSSGNAYVTGSTGSHNFPKPDQAPVNQGTSDVFVAKLNTNKAGAASLLYSAYLGGSGNDYGTAIAVDAAGHAYVTGYTSSTDFPTRSQYQTAQGGGDAFVTKLDTNRAGKDSLLYSTYLGGNSTSLGTSIAVDAAGHAYVTGTTRSTDFPVLGQYQTDQPGDDIFVTKLDTSRAGAASLLYSTYLGGSASDASEGIAVDSSGNVYVTGTTRSPDFPARSQYQTAQGGGDAFVTKLDTNRAGKDSLLYSTYLGGKGFDSATSIAVDASGNAYVAGTTSSADFPLKNQYQTFQGETDAFVMKLNPALSGAASLLYSTYLGGSDFDEGYGIAVNSSGIIYVTGFTRSNNLPTLKQEQTDREGADAFATKLNPNVSGAASLLYSTYLGGKGSDAGFALAVDSAGKAYVTGSTHSLDFPAHKQYQADQLQDGAFVTKLNDSDTYSISGYVTRPDGYGIVEGVFLDGSTHNDSTISDTDGYFFFEGLEKGGSYTVYPSSDVFIFEPESVSFDDLQSDEFADFTGYATATFGISGFVTDGDGNGIEGVYVELSGSGYDGIYTEYDGFYYFPGLPQGNYTITPYSDYYDFNPEYQYFYFLRSDEEADFTAYATATFSISGYVTRSDGSPLSFVTVELTGSDYQTTSTDFYGYYYFENVPPGGEYLITPYKGPFLTFEPEAQYIDSLQSSQRADFYVNPATISGSAGVGGATVTLTSSGYDVYFEPRSVTSAADGSFSFPDVPIPAHYLTIKPTKPNYRFSPGRSDIPLLLGDDTEQYFAAFPKTYSITGTVKLGAARLPGVTVKLTSPGLPAFATQTTTTNSGGAYAFYNLPPDRNYTVTATMNGYPVIPQSKSVSHLSANQVLNFAVQTYNITGRITRPGTTTGLGDVIVTLTSPIPANFPARTVRTSSTGVYTFTSLPAGRTYKLKPAKSGVTFSPLTRTITNLRSNIPAGVSTNFTGAGP